MITNKGGSLNAQGKFSARNELARVLAAMGKMDGNVPFAWIPPQEDATRAPNKGKRAR